MLEVASLWIGSTLGDIELASIRSFESTGHRFILYAYERIGNCPKSVDLRDARSIYNPGRVLRYSGNGSPSIHANFFRYNLIAKTDLLWVDLDVIALRPFRFSAPDVFGLEVPDRVNNAVLRLSHNSPTLKSLLSFDIDRRYYPPCLSTRKMLRFLIEQKGLPATVENWPFTSTGPMLLTWAVKKNSEFAKALPQSAFYPVPYWDCRNLVEPGMLSPESFGLETFGVHLWSNYLKNVISVRHSGIIPKDSFLGLAIRGF